MTREVTAIILAAGESRRMGKAKLLLPWGETTVLGQTLHQLQASQVEHLLLVSGHRAAEVEAIAANAGARVVHNEAYAEGEMLSSLQVGLRHLEDGIEAVLVVLADQPLIEPAIVDRLLKAYEARQGTLIAPSYQGKRGNPVLIDRRYFAELLALPWGQAPRTLLRRHPAELHLVAVDSPTVLLDLDRPEEYERHRPAAQT